MGNDGEVIFIVCPLYQHATAALSAPRRIDSKMKGSLSSSTILNEMTQDSVADSLDRCMLGDLCACLFAGPQEQILTVYFSKLKAMGRQQFLYFWTLDKLSPARCKHTWQGAIFLTYPPPMPENGGEKNLNSKCYWFVIPSLWCLYTTETFQLHRGFPIISWLRLP